MKSLKQYIEECVAGPAAGGIYATPGNTMGSGNPVMPGENGEVGSGDILAQNKAKSSGKRRKRKSKYKDIKSA